MRYVRNESFGLHVVKKIPKCTTFAHYETLFLNFWADLVNLELSMLVRTELLEEAPL